MKTAITITVCLICLVSCGNDASSSDARVSEPQVRADHTTTKPSPQKTKKEPTKATNVDPNDFDILGIHLADNVSQAQSILDNHIPELKVHRDNMDISNVNGAEIYGITFDSGLYAETVPQYDPAGKPSYWKEIISMSFSPLPNEGKVTGVSRSLPFQEPMLRTELENMLLEKYGPPLYQDANWLSWSTDLEGYVIDNPNLLKACTPKRWAFQAFRRDFVSDAMRHCGFIFTIKLTPAQMPDLITYMHTTMYDMGTIMDYNTKTVAYTRIEAQKLREQELEAAKNRPKPKL